MPDPAASEDLDASLQSLLDAASSRGGGKQLVIALLHEMTDLVMQRQPRGGALSATQAAYLVGSGAFAPDELAELQRGVSGGKLAEAERATRLEAVVESLSTVEVAKLLGVEASQVHAIQNRRDLYGFTVGGQRRYPRWQFTDDPSHPTLPQLTKLLLAFPDDMHPVSVQRFMTLPQPGLRISDRPVTPAEWLLRGNSHKAVTDILDSFLQS